MTIEVVLHNVSTGENDTVIVNNVSDSKHFSYVDNESNNCEMYIYDDGICLFRQTNGYKLELNLTSKSYAKISSKEGEFEFDIKVIDFHKNNDILVMRYISDEQEREIKILFRS